MALILENAILIRRSVEGLAGLAGLTANREVRTQIYIIETVLKYGRCSTPVILSIIEGIRDVL